MPCVDMAPRPSCITKKAMYGWYDECMVCLPVVCRPLWHWAAGVPPEHGILRNDHATHQSRFDGDLSTIIDSGSRQCC
ncbi:hypothetical protein CEXT_237871 [Caerostris extrusa]|uniref:Uncharacterized protein n=1 Tax=Caerostris extrusa TaxID=172846 RepID=A0AAV4XEU9_CAEEX|nr:hypothetical protein CEXT_237871 [Caerostris extrusa]